MHISICICTYQRPEWLRRLINDLCVQDTRGAFTFEIVIVDNDPEESARQTVSESIRSSRIPIIYATEPRRSISFARNMSVARATGDAIAFIDDDEFPDANWLYYLWQALQKYAAAGVLGPVRPSFEEGAPAWVIKGGFYDRPDHPTGYELKWTQTRTGNVLFNRAIIAGMDPLFRTEFGTGSGDQDFFRRLMRDGHKFVWCNEAAVKEIVPPSRWQRGTMIRRAVLRGQNSWRQAEGRWPALFKALLAVPLYLLFLPFLLLAGQHHFMKFLIKLCDHVGRLAASIGLNPVGQRSM